MSGADLARKVRRNHPKITVIIASGYGPGGPAIDGVRFVNKPYSAVDLQQALGQAIDRAAPV
jgi:FixJ family two-component response regulator